MRLLLIIMQEIIINVWDPGTGPTGVIIHDIIIINARDYYY